MGGDAMSTAAFWLITPPHDYLVVDASTFPDALQFARTSPVIDGMVHLNEEDTVTFLASHPALAASWLPTEHRKQAPPPIVTEDMVNDEDVDDWILGVQVAIWSNEMRWDR
jgi:hypothetical protein